VVIESRRRGPRTWARVASALAVQLLATSQVVAGVVPHAQAQPVDLAQVGGAQTMAVAANEQAFALDLLSRLGPSSLNLVLSPSSLATLLAMLEPGAAGATSSGIAEAMHATSLAPAVQASGWDALGKDLAARATADHLVLDSANASWIQSGFPVRPQYVQVLEQDFASSVEEADFHGDPAGAARAIDSWVSSQTRGHINDLVTAPELAQVVAVLVDAVYLSARWATPFDPSQTAEAIFHESGSTSAQVEMMSTPLLFSAPALASKSLGAVELMYKGGHFSALVLMPPLGQLAAFERDLTPSRLAQVLASLQSQAVQVHLPRFSISSSFMLNGALSAMGMGQAFSDAADFSNISPKPLKLAFVVQKAQVKVDESGTEASAASAAGAEPTAVPARPLELTFDHPFLFFVRDDTTGTVLFEAQVAAP